MSGRQIRRREVGPDTAPHYVMAAMSRMADTGATVQTVPELAAIKWPELPELPGEDSFMWLVFSGGWPYVTGLVTDFQPRRGRKLQAWKHAEVAAEYVEISAGSAQKLIDALDQLREAIDEDEDLGLDEQLDKLNKIEEMVELLNDYSRQCDDCAATIRALEFPKLRPATR